MASDDKTPLNDTDSKPDYSTIFDEKKEEFAKQTVFGEVCLSLQAPVHYSYVYRIAGYFGGH